MASAARTTILSLDYELFFHESGSVSKCMLEPVEALLDSARRANYAFTLYVDAGMLVRMRELSSSFSQVRKDYDAIRRQLGQAVDDGHDIGLHIHPHWEDTRLEQGRWQFEGTRYQLRDFDDAAIADIVARYSAELAASAGMQPASYRAGGFCIEPFSRLKDSLRQAGITTDSSVVPRLKINDAEKGVDFSSAPDLDWWFFDDSPLRPVEQGAFLEMPVSSQILPFFYYWRRLFSKLTGSESEPTFGDGSAKRLRQSEVIRRLTGAGRVAEVSVDEPKVEYLQRVAGSVSPRRLLHVMGHPKNISHRSLKIIEKMIERSDGTGFVSVADVARRIRSRQPS